MSIEIASVVPSLTSAISRTICDVSELEKRPTHEGRKVELEEEGAEGRAEDDADGRGRGVDRVRLHALEDDAALADGLDDRRQAGLGEHDVRRAARRIRRALDGDADVGLAECGSVVGAVAGHRRQVALGLQRLDDLELVLRKDAREAVGVHWECE